MIPMPQHDPLALSESWGSQAHDQVGEAPLISLVDALETSCLRRGITREAFLSELLRSVHQRRLIPLLAMLPRNWKQTPSALPSHLRGLGSMLEGGLVTPLLLAALADDLQHLIPKNASTPATVTNALTLWSSTSVTSSEGTHELPQSIQAWRRQSRQAPKASDARPTQTRSTSQGLLGLGAGLVWHNNGLNTLQSASSRWGNTLLAQVLNALGANRLPSPWMQATNRKAPFTFEGVSTPQELIRLLSSQGWQCRARIRASVASFGLGASSPDPSGSTGWQQIPLALPYRTGLLADGNELEALLPHCSLELELTPADGEPASLLQYYQGTEGLNGWAALNDLHRPWQNDRLNGTVKYPGEPLEGQRLELALDLCDLMAAVHNTAAAHGKLQTGGYGALGFCIDSTALLEQALTGRCHLFPLTLGGIWRERLRDHLDQLLNQGLRVTNDSSVERYRRALDTLPSDLNIHGLDCASALERLRASQPEHSPFLLVRRLSGEDNPS